MQRFSPQQRRRHPPRRGLNARSDNRLENLAWGTPLEDRGDMARHGTRPAVAKVGIARLKNPDTDVPRMHCLYRRGRTLQEIANEEYAVDKNTVHRILKGLAYVSSQPPPEERAVMRRPCARRGARPQASSGAVPDAAGPDKAP